MKEQWRPIEGFIGYEVSNYGSVRSVDRTCGDRYGVVKGKVLKQTINKRGYPEVRLFSKSKSTLKVVHRLVAKAFIENKQNSPQVNHINGIKTDNSVKNLEWVTNSENQKHAFKTGLKKTYGENNPRATISDAEVTKLKELYNYGMSVREAAICLNTTLSIARAIIYKSSWKSNKTVVLTKTERKARINQQL